MQTCSNDFAQEMHVYVPTFEAGHHDENGRLAPDIDVQTTNPSFKFEQLPKTMEIGKSDDDDDENNDYDAEKGDASTD